MGATLTMKFGGTSVGDAPAIQKMIAITQRIQPDWGAMVVVVSAMRGVTDQLEAGIRQAAAGQPETARQLAADLFLSHQIAAEILLVDERNDSLAQFQALLEDYQRLCESVAVLGEFTPRALDYALGLGERMNARLVAAALRQAGLQAQAIDAGELIVSDDRYGDAAPLPEPTRTQTRRRLLPLLKKSVIPVVTGFIAATAQGVSTTLGRGGSDYSAALIGASLDSDEVWIWTDVDGVMSADPRLVPAARSVPSLTYREVTELAYFGARVLHPKTIRPVVEAGIPLRVKNTFNPDHPGTLVIDQPTAAGGIRAITHIPDISLITVEGMGMLGVPGIAARTFGAVARTGSSVLLISQASSEQSICFALPIQESERAVAALEREFELELTRRDIDRIWRMQPLSIVTVVGAGMRSTPGIAGRVFSATGDQGINVIAIVQGSSECSISLVVEAQDGEEAVRAIHHLALGKPSKQALDSSHG
jgi:aspartate kinase